jgi:hypothetical protein
MNTCWSVRPLPKEYFHKKMNKNNEGKDLVCFLRLLSFLVMFVAHSWHIYEQQEH